MIDDARGRRADRCLGTGSIGCRTHRGDFALWHRIEKVGKSPVPAGGGRPFSFLSTGPRRGGDDPAVRGGRDHPLDVLPEALQEWGWTLP